jgi:hypothetical protein
MLQKYSNSKEQYGRALLVGTVRDVEKYCKNDIQRLLDAIERYIPVVCFVVESDSSDNTVKTLENLSAIDKRVRFVTLGQLEGSMPNRLERLKHCRNVYIQELRDNPEYKDCGLIVVADLDGINTTITGETVNHVMDSDLEWDVLSANQSGRYYDILALRHPYWSPNSFTHEMQWLTPFLGKKKAWKHSLGDRIFKIDPFHPPIAVDSAFGGLCFYKRWIMQECDYSNDDDNDKQDTDHVILNRKARHKGAKIFIHPGLINAKWTTHSLSTISWIRAVKSISHVFPFTLLLPLLRRLTLYIGTKTS